MRAGRLVAAAAAVVGLTGALTGTATAATSVPSQAPAATVAGISYPLGS